MTDIERAQEAVRAAVAAGASAADAVLIEEDDTAVHVRDGRTEQVQNSLSRGIGVRAFQGARAGIAYTNDTTPASIRDAAQQAVALASVAAPDESAGLPDREEQGAIVDDLALVDEDRASWTAETWLDLARRAEEAATADERIAISEGSGAGGGHARVVFVNSDGFTGEQECTHCRVHVSVFATGDAGERQRAGWHSSAARRDLLEDPESVGREAAERAIRRCGYRKPPTGAYPVVFPPEITRDFARTLAGAVSAAAVFRHATFLADALGETVGSPALTLVDDATLPGRPGSRAFDGEGVRTRRTVLFEQGRLASWLADSYSARRVDFQTTGSARRDIHAGPHVGTSNLVFAPGERSPEELIGEIDQGLFVTDLFGMGVNLAAGSWSRGGGGLWIENGRLAHPVQELTVAGDLRAILRGVREAANDLTWLGASAAPTIRIDAFTIAAG